ncbi:hypothetical protein UFOVP844_58 [uncultured Caudovirales phage]|uniref:Large polyvalent protein associated domain-containing protein n=1 Tax=uncultured Caudovirales phage TaxID=2100421 RepID=A0A6J5PBI7_9CAUD|nr:hypothetical protein UFOVP844_58 [uncultured Caudovirales phage]
MAIVFQGQQDPWGLAAIGSTLGEGFQKAGLMQGQEKMKLAAEQRLMDRKKSFGPLLDNALAVVQDPQATPEMKVGALTKYVQETGDNKSVSSILGQILKNSNNEAQAEADYNLLKPVYENFGISLPETRPKGVSPQAVRGLGNIATPRYESESDKLAAQANAEYQKQIFTDYEAAEASDVRLNQQLGLANSGQLPTPAMVKTMDYLGFPLGILSNPAAELYEKVTQSNVLDVSKAFPGAIKNFEIESYMKTIPQLINSDDGKKIIIENKLIENDQKRQNALISQKIIEENNGRMPKDYRYQMMDRTRESRLKNAEKYKENIERAINITEYPTQKVEKGTPVTVSIAKNYLHRAEFDLRNEKNKLSPEQFAKKRVELGMKLAREDGYDVKPF